jgi:ubiquitin carboxyl-terminal hydrolase 16
MPEKTLTVATYAAGASLAAITLFYVFGPTFTLEDTHPTPSATSNFLGISSARKKGVVGLSNPANDCFINSVLQALAGLGDLRLYLIRETHRRSLDDTWVYAQAIPPEARGDLGDRWAQMADWKIEGLQRGLVTKSLKDVLDALNERPIYKKTISATPFLRSLEAAFRQRISRQQQDAQEFLQVVAERLCDEYHAGRKARNFARRKGALADSLVGDKLATLALEDEAEWTKIDGDAPSPSTTPTAPNTVDKPLDQEEPPEPQRDDDGDDEEGFPMEGKQESQIECLTCGFKPQPKESTFCTLIVNVPQTSTTTLNACFDGLFKTEHIDDFKCEKCRLLHAMTILEAEASKSSTPAALKSRLLADMAKLQTAIDTDPEKVPEDIQLPDLSLAPKRRIARHTRLTNFPKILAIHLSRSIYDSQMSQKNAAKVSFPERLPLGGLLQQKKYKLLGVVTHKGSHHSGHYESFRRQNVYAPFANPNTFQPSDVYSASTAGTPASTPRIAALKPDTSPLASTPDLLEPAASTSTVQEQPQTPNLGPKVQEQPQTSNLVPKVSLSSLRRLRSSSATTGSPSSSPSRLSKDPETASIRSVAASALSRIRSSSRNSCTGSGDSSPPPDTTETPAIPTTVTKRPGSIKDKKKQKKQQDDRWWRISDDKIQQASTRDVLEMKQEVYLLFYEMERETF